MKKLATALVMLCTMSGCSSVQAIGDTERGVLYGIGGTILLGTVLENRNQRGEPQYYPDYRDGDFPPFRCSGDSVKCAYARGVWEREYQQWLEAKDRAYQCGRYGKCEDGNAPY